MVGSRPFGFEVVGEIVVGCASEVGEAVVTIGG